MFLSDPEAPTVPLLESLFEKNACGPICLAAVAESLDRPDLSDRNMNSEGRITATYTLRNNTAHEAIISEVATSCGCATPRLSADIIPPHDEIELRVEVQLAQEANRTFQIDVEFSQPENEILELPGMIVSR